MQAIILTWVFVWITILTVTAFWPIREMKFVVSPGDRIAQILFMPVLHNVVEHDGRVSETERGLGGFGSTGS